MLFENKIIKIKIKINFIFLIIKFSFKHYVLGSIVEINLYVLCY